MSGSSYRRIYKVFHQFIPKGDTVKVFYHCYPISSEKLLPPSVRKMGDIRVLLKLQFQKNFHSKTVFCAAFWNKTGANTKTSSETNQVSEEVYCISVSVHRLRGGSRLPYGSNA